VAADRLGLAGGMAVAVDKTRTGSGSGAGTAGGAGTHRRAFARLIMR
jgi:uncharacterized spore protein YtfJ